MQTIMNRTQILNNAESVSASRTKTHGNFTENMEHFDRLLCAWMSPPRFPENSHWVAPMLLALNKLSRIACGDHTNADHWVDLCNYIAQAGEMAMAEVPKEDFNTPIDGSLDYAYQERP